MGVLEGAVVKPLGAIKDCVLEGAGSPGEVPSAKQTRKTAKSAESGFGASELSRLGGESVIAVHESTGCAPSRMLFSRDLHLSGDLLFGRSSNAPASPMTKLCRQGYTAALLRCSTVEVAVKVGSLLRKAALGRHWDPRRCEL
ncbi:hypothetical protein TNCV_3615991 [Trichonephila clavipes]|nr:hypothetical protein TNCV_3615991 [Trichonephila clavipes]